MSGVLKPVNAQPCVWTWLNDMRESSALLGATLGIIHPELYKAGWKAMRLLQDNPNLVKEGREMLDVLPLWSSPFSAYSIIANRCTPFHRDNQSRKEWYDMLVSVGDYQEAELSMPGIGPTFAYNSGTVMAFSGKVLQHGVGRHSGNRLCIAHYMRDKVHERLGIQAPGWMNVDSYGLP